MLPHGVVLSVSLTATGAVLPAQVVSPDSARADSAARLVSAAHLHATTAPPEGRESHLRATLRLADSIVATSPAPRTASMAFLIRCRAAGVRPTTGRPTTVRPTTARPTTARPTAGP